MPQLIQKDRETFFKINFDTFFLSTNEKDCWFLTKNNEIIALERATKCGKQIQIIGKKIKQLFDFFTVPFLSHYLNIYQAELNFETNEQLYDVNDVKCKMIGLKTLNNSFTVFMPLLHTL